MKIMKLSLKIYCLFCLLFIMQQNNCYAQLSYNELPDTLFQEYKYERVAEQIEPDKPWVNHYHHQPIQLEVSVKNVKTKPIYKDCTDCIYEEYVDSLEVRPGYNKILLQKEINYNYDKNRSSNEEWAWVKMYEEIPKDHKPCLDIAEIDTCLWKYVIIQEAKYDSSLSKTFNHIPDTIRIPPLIIPIKKYRLKNKSYEEIEQLAVIDIETVSVPIYKIIEEEKLHIIPDIGTVEYKTAYKNVLAHFKKITPLNYKE